MRIIERCLINVALRTRRMERVGSIERLFLIRAGKRDASIGLPKEGNDGRWMTAYIQREVGSCNETLSRRQQLIQKRMMVHYAHAKELAGNIQQVESEAAQVIKRIPEAPTEEEAYIRKHGEEELTDEQVCKRRVREYERTRQKIEEEAALIRGKADDDVKKLIKEESFISQVEELLEIYSSRIIYHSISRIEVYWNSFYANNKDNARMPAFYQHELGDVTRIDFKKLHAEEHELIGHVLGKYKEDAA